MGVASVGLLYATVRRSPGRVGRAARRRRAGADAGRGADVPVQQPGRAAVLLLIGAGAYATIRASESPSGPCAGSRSPARSSASGSSPRCCRRSSCCRRSRLAYLVAAPAGLGARLAHLLVAFGAMVVAGGWWVLIVELWPASSRPYIGGSQNNSSSSSPWATTASAGSPATRSAASAAAAAAVAGADRLLGCSTRDRRSDRVAAAGRAGARRCRPLATRRAARTDQRAPRCCCGAAGSGHRRWCSATWPGSSTRTTRWRWRPRSPRWSGSAPLLWWRRVSTSSRRAVLAVVRRADRAR